MSRCFAEVVLEHLDEVSRSLESGLLGDVRHWKSRLLHQFAGAFHPHCLRLCRMSRKWEDCPRPIWTLQKYLYPYYIYVVGCIPGRHKEPGTVYLYHVFCWHGTRYVRLAEDISYCIILCKTVGGTGPEFMVCLSRGSDILSSCGLRFLFVNHWMSMPWNVLSQFFASFVRIKTGAEKIIFNDASQWQWEV